MVKELFRSTVLRHPPEDIGEALMSWQFPEYVKHERSKRWYVAALVLSGLLLLYAVFTTNFLFAIIVLVFLFIGIFQYFQEPRNLRVTIAEDGIVLAKRFYPFKELASFWMVYEPPRVKNLYLDFKSRGKRSLSIPLENVNPLDLRDLLNEFLEEDLEREQEFFDEALSRVMKLQ